MSGSGWSSASSSTLATNNDLYGGGFKMQDYIYVTDTNVTNFEYDYCGKYMTAILTYNKKFANLNGNLKLFYSHTGNSTSLSDLTLSNSGVSASFSSSSSCWTAYSYATTF